ncbi:ABC transporter substrate-binding protein [Thalassococcus sp. S3]|uniref:ABC transporter substrate-binding protein n=1 Tax=Thalassococcus sp. S3 TaxID=2017482 RepID=UPI001024537D|nr:ABC transporter substrate-binding protein [Thalassococcus sp. S3]QBF33443.1 nitrate ABC transporter substrate-binding protein [Thalassococcus sp. S3]
MNIKTLVMAMSLAIAPLAATAQEQLTYLFPAPDFLPAFAPFQLAKGLGYFEEEGLEVEFRVGQGGADVARQVAVGNADLGGGIGDTPIIVRANGLDVRGVALLGGRGYTQLAWRVESGITGPADLEGKRIGVMSFQDTTYYNILGVLASEGLSRGDADLQAVGPGGIIQLMISGDLDAVSAVPEWIAAIQGAGVELGQMPVDEVFPAMAQAVLASDDIIAERPEVITSFVRALTRAVNDIVADPAAAAAQYVQLVPQHADKEAGIAAIMQAYATQVYPAAEGFAFGAFNPERLEAAQAFYLEAGIVREAVPVADLYTNDFVASE